MLTKLHYPMLGFVLLFLGASVFFVFNSAPASERTERLFVYGTLENPVLRSIMCQCWLSSSKSELIDYQQTGLTIVPNPEARVGGKLLQVSPQELARFDHYEDVPNNYLREEVLVAGVPAWVYIKNRE